MKPHDEIIHFLKQAHQESLIHQLDKTCLDRLYAQVKTYQKRPIQELYYHPLQVEKKHFTSPHNLHSAQNLKAQKAGEQALKQNKVHAFCLAAGSGSRLQFDQPKALYPLKPHLTLLDHFLAQVPADQTMTLFCSNKSANPIREVLPSHYPTPLVQENLPYFNEAMEWILNEDGLAEGPDGNGSLIQTLVKSNTLDSLKKKGIEHIIIFPIDNPLLNPYDPTLIGTHILEGSDVSLKCFEKTSIDTQVGCIGSCDGKTHIIDYHNVSYIKLKHVNINHLCLSIEWLEKHLERLPLHWVPKKLGNTKIFKGERFITDLVKFADRVSLVVDKRQKCFAPLKTVEDLPHILETLYS